MPPSSNSSERNRKNWLEWTVFVVSGLFVLSTAGFLAKQALFEKESPPKMEIRLGEVIRSAWEWEVPVTVTNRGNEVASDVQIEVQAESQEGIKIATFTVPYLPKKATRHGSVSFQGDEPVFHFTGRVAGYSRP
jgi:uncharacterized protein (TIGR02588 family)